MEFSNLTVREAESADVDELGDFLWEAAPQVLHYVGFGRFQGRDEILLGPENTDPLFARSSSCSMLFDSAATSGHPRDGGGGASECGARGFLGLRSASSSNTALTRWSGSNIRIDKTAVNRFNKTLYSELLRGRSLELATQAGRRTIRATSQVTSRSFISPAVFLSRVGPFLLCLPGAPAEPLTTPLRSDLLSVANV